MVSYWDFFILVLLKLLGLCAITIQREKVLIIVPRITLKAARVNAGLTQREAAKKLGISYQTLSRYEDENGSVRQDILKKMSNLYRMPVEFIFLNKKYSLMSKGEEVYE